jgi:hypothetical protein
MEIQRKGRYDLMYQNAQQLGERTTKTTRIFGIEDNQLIIEKPSGYRKIYKIL